MYLLLLIGVIISSIDIHVLGGEIHIWASVFDFDDSPFPEELSNDDSHYYKMTIPANKIDTTEVRFNNGQQPRFITYFNKEVFCNSKIDITPLKELNRTEIEIPEDSSLDTVISFNNYPGKIELEVEFIKE